MNKLIPPITKAQIILSVLEDAEEAFVLVKEASVEMSGTEVSLVVNGPPSKVFLNV